DPYGAWLQGMRAALNRLRDAQSVALIGDGTAAYEFALRGAERQHIPTIVIRCSDSPERSTRARKKPEPKPCPTLPDILRAELWTDSSAPDDFVSAMPADV